MSSRFAVALASLGFVAVVASSGEARAQATVGPTFEGRRVPAAWQLSPEAPPAAPTMVKETYTSHVLLVDALAVTTLFVGLNKESGPVVAAAGAMYLSGGPAVHLAHGRKRTAGASLGLRVLAPLVTGAIVGGGFALAFPSTGSGPDDTSTDRSLPFAIGAVLGGTAGLIAAPVLDATLLARQEWFDDLPVVPQVSVTANGASVGVAGVF